MLANFIQTSNVPTVEVLQSSIEKQGFRLTLPSSWNTRSAEAVVAFELAGGRVDPVYDYDKLEPTFCDIDSFVEDEELDDSMEVRLRTVVGDRTGCLSIVLAGEPEHAAAGFMLSYCLSKDFDAMCFDADLMTTNNIEALTPEALKAEITYLVDEHFQTS